MVGCLLMGSLASAQYSGFNRKNFEQDARDQAEYQARDHGRMHTMAPATSSRGDIDERQRAIALRDAAERKVNAALNRDPNARVVPAYFGSGIRGRMLGGVTPAMAIGVSAVALVLSNGTLSKVSSTCTDKAASEQCKKLQAQFEAEEAAFNATPMNAAASASGSK